MKASRLVAVVVIVLLCAVIVGCTADAAAPTAVPIDGANDGPADITGTVSEWSFIQGEGSMLVQGTDPTGADFVARVRVTGQTQIIQQVNGELKASEITQLKDGETVQVRFDGPVAESFPVQATAGEVIIME